MLALHLDLVRGDGSGLVRQHAPFGICRLHNTHLHEEKQHIHIWNWLTRHVSAVSGCRLGCSNYLRTFTGVILDMLFCSSMSRLNACYILFCDVKTAYVIFCSVMSARFGTHGRNKCLLECCASLPAIFTQSVLLLMTAFNRMVRCVVAVPAVDERFATCLQCYGQQHKSCNRICERRNKGTHAWTTRRLK